MLSLMKTYQVKSSFCKVIAKVLFLKACYSLEFSKNVP